MAQFNAQNCCLKSVEAFAVADDVVGILAGASMIAQLGDLIRERLVVGADRPSVAIRA
jgi:hypothetical protein